MAIHEESGNPRRPSRLTRDLADKVRAFWLAQLPAYGENEGLGELPKPKEPTNAAAWCRAAVFRRTERTTFADQTRRTHSQNTFIDEQPSGEDGHAGHFPILGCHVTKIRHSLP
jgi:hypothetical protein